MKPRTTSGNTTTQETDDNRQSRTTPPPLPLTCLLLRPPPAQQRTAPVAERRDSMNADAGNLAVVAEAALGGHLQQEPESHLGPIHEEKGLTADGVHDHNDVRSHNESALAGPPCTAPDDTERSRDADDYPAKAAPSSPARKAEGNGLGLLSNHLSTTALATTCTTKPDTFSATNGDERKLAHLHVSASDSFDFAKFLAWLPTAEDLQAGLPFSCRPADDCRVDQNPIENDIGSASSDDMKNKLAETDPLTLQQHLPVTVGVANGAKPGPKKRGRKSKAEIEKAKLLAKSALLTESASAGAATQPAASTFTVAVGLDGSKSAVGLLGSDQMKKLDVVKALREWLLPQPVHLGRPVGPDNPTIYSLYLRWADSQRGTAEDGGEKELLGRAADAEDGLSPLGGGDTTVSSRGRARKAPAHLRSFELYEESWIQGRKNKKKLVSEKVKAIEKKLQSQLERDEMRLGTLPSNASPSTKRKRPESRDEGAEEQGHIGDESLSSAAQKKRKASGNKDAPKPTGDEEDDQTARAQKVKPGKARGRGRIRSSLDMKDSEASDAIDEEDDEGEEATSGRRAKREKMEDAAELEDPTFVPPSSSSAPSDGKKAVREGGKNPRKASKKNDQLKHVRPATVESCHRCKNRKEYWMGCPVVEAHRYCKGCVERHFKLDYELMSPQSAEIWAGGCPICKLTCQCASCKRRKEALDAGLSPPAKRRKSSSSDGGEHEKTDGKVGLIKAPSLQIKPEVVPLPTRGTETPAAHNSKEQGHTSKPAKRGKKAPGESTPSVAAAKADAKPGRKRSLDKMVDDEEEVSDEKSSGKAGRRILTRSRTKDKPPSPAANNSPASERELPSLPPSAFPVETPRNVRQENGYYILEKGGDVESFVGLTGAGSVLSRRYPATPIPGKASSGKTYSW